MTDIMTRAVHDAGVAISLVRCGGVARRICQEQHGLSGEPARALAAAIASSLVLATRMKGRGLLSWSLKCEGAFAQHRVDAMGMGMVRAMVGPHTHEQLRTMTASDPLFGPGRLSVSRQLEGSEQSYTSTLAIEDDERDIPSIANALLQRSDQVPARVLYYIEADLRQVVACYIERLPDETNIPLPARIPALLSDPEATLPDIADDGELLRELIGDDAIQILHHYGVSFHCPCSRERFHATLKGFPKEQLLELQENGRIVTRCDFCHSSYDIPLDDLL